MVTINLKDYFYWYIEDEFVEVTEEVAAELRADKQYEAAFQRKITRYHARHSLDAESAIEYHAFLREPSPQELLDRADQFYRLWNALNSLPETQGRRVEAYYILGKNYREIADAEGIMDCVARRSVQRGINKMRGYLKKFF